MSFRNYNNCTQRHWHLFFFGLVYENRILDFTWNWSGCGEMNRSTLEDVRFLQKHREWRARVMVSLWMPKNMSKSHPTWWWRWKRRASATGYICSRGCYDYGKLQYVSPSFRLWLNLCKIHLFTRLPWALWQCFTHLNSCVQTIGSNLMFFIFYLRRYFLVEISFSIAIMIKMIF
jgi:hypothetical protein